MRQMPSCYPTGGITINKGEPYTEIYFQKFIIKPSL